MIKKIFSRISKYLPQILALLFIGAFAVFAWTEPSSAPPGGNVPAPINVSTSTQYKAGALGIGGLLRGYSDAIFDGNVGIGTVSPGAKLDIEGGNLDMSSNRIINLADPANPQDAATKNYVDSNDAKGLYGWVQISPVACPNGGGRYPSSCTKLSPGLCNLSYVIPDCEFIDGISYERQTYAAGCESGYQSIKTGAACALTGSDCSGTDEIKFYSCYKSP